MNERRPEESALKSTSTPARQIQTPALISSAEAMRQPPQSNTTQAAQTTQHTAPNQLSSSGNPHDAEDFKSHSGIWAASAHELPVDNFDPDALSDDFDPDTLFASGEETASAGVSSKVIRRGGRVGSVRRKKPV